MKHHPITLRLHADNENEQFSFITLGAATLNVVRYLEKNRDQAPNGEPDKNPEKDAERQREKDRFLETRLREIDRFESRYLRDRARR
jgi:hypothetical protein